MFVSIADEIDSEAGFSSEEAVEVGWFDVAEVLERSKANEMFLAPPQWFMLKELKKLDYSSLEFARNVQKYCRPSFIQPQRMVVFGIRFCLKIDFTTTHALRLKTCVNHLDRFNG